MHRCEYNTVNDCIQLEASVKAVVEEELGNSIGIGELTKKLKAVGQVDLSKSISGLHKARNSKAHPQHGKSVLSRLRSALKSIKGDEGANLVASSSNDELTTVVPDSEEDKKLEGKCAERFDIHSDAGDACRDEDKCEANGDELGACAGQLTPAEPKLDILLELVSKLEEQMKALTVAICNCPLSCHNSMLATDASVDGVDVRDDVGAIGRLSGGKAQLSTTAGLGGGGLQVGSPICDGKANATTVCLSAAVTARRHDFERDKAVVSVRMEGYVDLHLILLQTTSIARLSDAARLRWRLEDEVELRLTADGLDIALNGLVDDMVLH